MRLTFSYVGTKILFRFRKIALLLKSTISYILHDSFKSVQSVKIIENVLPLHACFLTVRAQRTQLVYPYKILKQKIFTCKYQNKHFDAV